MRGLQQQRSVTLLTRVQPSLRTAEPIPFQKFHSAATAYFVQCSQRQRGVMRAMPHRQAAGDGNAGAASNRCEDFCQSFIQLEDLPKGLAFRCAGGRQTAVVLVLAVGEVAQHDRSSAAESARLLDLNGHAINAVKWLV